MGVVPSADSFHESASHPRRLVLTILDWYIQETIINIIIDPGMERIYFVMYRSCISNIFPIFFYHILVYIFFFIWWFYIV